MHEEIIIDDELHELEYIMLRLRSYRGIDLKEYEQKFSKSAELIKKAGPYLESRRLVHQNDHLSPTEQGFLIIDKITHDLL
jgi:coproporphyrinogen III oxidase-like Fe-S oxidoreductase